MSSAYDKKVILFQVGASGHFLAEFLTTEDITVLPNQRIDHSIDQNRRWTLNDFPDSIPQCIEFLIANSKKYSNFSKDSNC